MDSTCEIKEDTLLRRFLSNPELVDRPVTISHGFAAMRFLVAAIDAFQVLLVSFGSSALMRPGHLAEAAGVGVMGAGLALLIRRGARPTTSFQRITVGMVARRAALAILAAGFIILITTGLVGGPSKAAQLLPWIAVWSVIAALVSFTARSLPITSLRRVTLRAIQPTVAVVGGAPSAYLMTEMLSNQGTHLVVAQLDPDKPHQLRRLEQLAARGKIDKVVIVGCNESVVENVCFALSDTPTLVCIGFATSTTSSLMAGGLHATQHPPFLPLLPSPISDWRGILKRSLDIV
ncbi:MAG: hypothetical protein M3N26_02945, partial [Pseudomonadota bacterium]|nr:hypothetical protein [Pseudomonadota bacterium]